MTDWLALADKLVIIDYVLIGALVATLLVIAFAVVRRADFAAACLIGAAGLVEIAIVIVNQAVAPRLVRDWEPAISLDPNMALAVPSIFNLAVDVLHAVVLVLVMIALVRLARRSRK